MILCLILYDHVANSENTPTAQILVSIIFPIIQMLTIQLLGIQIIIEASLQLNNMPSIDQEM